MMYYKLPKAILEEMYYKSKFFNQFLCEQSVKDECIFLCCNCIENTVFYNL